MRLKSKEQIFSADRKRLMRLVAKLQEQLARSIFHCENVLDSYGVAGSQTKKYEAKLAEARKIKREIYEMVKVDE